MVSVLHSARAKEQIRQGPSLMNVLYKSHNLFSTVSYKGGKPNPVKFSVLQTKFLF